MPSSRDVSYTSQRNDQLGSMELAVFAFRRGRESQGRERLNKDHHPNEDFGLQETKINWQPDAINEQK